MSLKSTTIYMLAFSAIVLCAAAWWLWRFLFRDGIGASGHFDDEGGIPSNPNSNDMSMTYKEAPFGLTHFDITEFDSPDAPGSGNLMQVEFLKKLDEARKLAGIPFRVNSGYRTAAHNAAIGGVKDSAHTRGWAADISAPSKEQKIAVVRAARAAGFNRFGIYDTFIHLDCDPAKTPDVAWNKRLEAVKKGGNFSKFLFDPFSI